MGEQLSSRGILKGHTGWVTSIACPQDNSDMILSSSRDKSIIVWNLTRDSSTSTYGVPKRRLAGHSGFVQVRKGPTASPPLAPPKTPPGTRLATAMCLPCDSAEPARGAPVQTAVTRPVVPSHSQGSEFPA